jgi:hypothetical protein
VSEIIYRPSGEPVRFAEPGGRTAFTRARVVTRSAWPSLVRCRWCNQPNCDIVNQDFSPGGKTWGEHARCNRRPLTRSQASQPARDYIDEEEPWRL